MKTLRNTLNLYKEKGTRKYTELYAMHVCNGSILDQYNQFHFIDTHKIKKGDWFSAVYTDKKCLSVSKIKVKLVDHIDHVIG